MSIVTPRFNFSSDMPLPGLGSDHTEEHLANNALTHKIFNEYERVMNELSAALGDYNLQDLPFGQTDVSSSIRHLYNSLDTEIVSLKNDSLLK